MVAMLSLKQSMRNHVFNVFLGAMLVTLGQMLLQKSSSDKKCWQCLPFSPFINNSLDRSNHFADSIISNSKLIT